MKILIMGFAKIKYMPYLNFYLDQIDRSRNEVHLLYWNRDLTEENLEHLEGVRLHEMRLYQEDDVSQVLKIRHFVRYRRFAKRVLQEKFDLIIALHTFPAVLLSDVLRQEYAGRFIFDYRDKTYEDLGFFRKLIHSLVHASCAAFVSSDAFRTLLPQDAQHKIYTSHNLLLEDVRSRDALVHRPSEKGTIRLAFWGILRNEALNREIIAKVAADERFELHYYGREQAVAHHLKAYVDTLGTDRVVFHGAYVPKDRQLFATETDMLHNVYADSNMMLAMANKYYDGLIFRIPQICMQGSFMGKQAETAGVGIQCDPYDPDFLHKLYDAYHALDREAFCQRCDVALEDILAQYEAGCAVIRTAAGSDCIEKPTIKDETGAVSCT